MNVSSIQFASWAVYTTMASCSAMGVVCNSILLFTTIRSKTLRSPCILLIGTCALFDVMHQMGTFIQAPQVYGGNTISSRICVPILFLPAMGVVGGSFCVLSIGIDRFLSMAAPNRYRSMNVPVYLAIHVFAICLFCAYNATITIYFYHDHEVVCHQPSLYTDEAIPLWAGAAAIVNLIAILLYTITWRLIKKQGCNIEAKNLARLFRTIVLVTMFDLGGWAITQGSVATLNAIEMPGDERFCYETAAGIAVNFGVAVKFIVYYSTSSDYREAVNQRFRKKSSKIADSSNRRSSTKG